jgi:ADP-dependent NAD(P)H-hydrate dehydratase / NAD(P)H-hydrate epimerase
VTFGTYKVGLLVDPGAGYAGAVTLVDIGLSSDLPDPVVESLQAADVAGLLPRPERASDKYRRGVVGVVAGSETYTGAAVLCVAGALYGGAGMVRFVAPERAAHAVRGRWPEAIVSSGRPSEAGRVQAWVAGPGMGTDPDAQDRLEDVLRSDVPVLIDADGVTLLAARHARNGGARPLQRAAATLLTPHAGELARLLGVERADVEARRLEHVRWAAREYGATVLLKGSTTLVASPEGGPVRVNGTGTPWLATAGSGDVLSGLGGALLASGLSALDAGSVAAYLHGLAARLASRDAPITSLDVATALPEVWRDVAPPGEG